jgi:hypothetical protein
MARDTRTDDEPPARRDEPNPPRKRPVRIKRDPDHTQLLERGEEPDGSVDSFEGAPGELTAEGDEGTILPDQEGTIDEGGIGLPHDFRGETGGVGGYSNLSGGIYWGEGSDLDAPNYGDWNRHSSGTSPAPGHEGLDYPGEDTWGESQRAWEMRLSGALPGPHAGRGPKSYQRSDRRIEEEIHERLTRHPDIDASDIEVHVEAGTVTLSGDLDARDAKWLAEDVVEAVAGVHEVRNRIRVRH